MKVYLKNLSIVRRLLWFLRENNQSWSSLYSFEETVILFKNNIERLIATSAIFVLDSSWDVSYMVNYMFSCHYGEEDVFFVLITCLYLVSSDDRFDIIRDGWLNPYIIH